MTNVANWVEQDTNTTGTGPVTVSGTIAGSTTWVQAFGSGTTEVWYSIENGDNRETGIGSFNGTTNVLTRTTVMSTLVSGTYNDSAPSAISLVGSSIVRGTFNAGAFNVMPRVFEQTGDPGASAKVGDIWIDTT